MKLDPLQRSRDFTTGQHPRRSKKSTQRQLVELDSRITAAFDTLGGGGTGNLVLDDLPEADASYIGQPVLVRGEAGQPTAVYVGSQDAFDNPVWVPQTAGDPYSLTHKRAIVAAGSPLGVPKGVAASPTSLYVGSNNNGKVIRYTHEGALVATYGPSATLADFPQGIAYDPVNDRVAVCGNDATTAYGFQVWTSDFSSRIFQAATSGTGNGQFQGTTQGVVADASGDWYVIDAGNLRIQKFSAAGSYLLKFSGPGFGGGLLQAPMGIAIDNDGNIHVVDADLGSAITWPRVQKFDASGTFLMEYGNPGPGPGQIGYPRGITCTDDNLLLVTDQLNRKIITFKADGTYVTETPLDKVLPNGNSPSDIADYRGSIFVIDRDFSLTTGIEQVHLFRAGSATTSSIVVAKSAAVVSQAARILDFSSKFLVTESPEGEANIDIDYATVAVGLNGSLVSADISTFDFSSDFTAVESPSGEVNVGLANVMGLIRLDGNSFAASTGFNVDSKFSNTYRKYLLVITVDDATSAGGLGLLMRDTSPANITAGYERAMKSMVSSGNTLTGNSATNAAEWSVMSLLNGAVDGTVWVDLVSPFQSDKVHGKFYSSQMSVATTTYQSLEAAIGLRATTPCGGFRVVPSAGNVSGRWALYAYPD